jgi:hypothetical protein
MECIFSTFVIYSSLKLQIDNPLGVLLGALYAFNKTKFTYKKIMVSLPLTN